MKIWMPISALAIIACLTIHFPFNPVEVATVAVLADDTSYFREADKNHGTRDELSTEQFEVAVAHFADTQACKKPWRWAHITTNKWLLKGTRYLVTKVDGENGYVANVHYGRGYWGDGRGMLLGQIPVAIIKQQAEADASSDCANDRSMTKLSHNDSPDNAYVDFADRYDPSPWDQFSAQMDHQHCGATEHWKDYSGKQLVSTCSAGTSSGNSWSCSCSTSDASGDAPR